MYEQVLERQRSARSGAEAIVPAPGKTLDRRGFVESKRIAAEQATVTGLLTTIGARADVSGSELYATSNQEMISASTLAGQDLCIGIVTTNRIGATRGRSSVGVTY